MFLTNKHVPFIVGILANIALFYIVAKGLTAYSFIVSVYVGVISILDAISIVVLSILCGMGEIQFKIKLDIPVISSMLRRMRSQKEVRANIDMQIKELKMQCIKYCHDEDLVDKNITAIWRLQRLKSGKPLKK